jgi:hypothetical protein
LATSFSPADYLNASLPSLKPRTSTTKSSSDEVPLAELSTQTQTLLSQLNAHTTRLTNTLTQLTDEILRSGSRLAYEVEVLRGEARGMSEVLGEGVREDVGLFIPEGKDNTLSRAMSGQRRGLVVEVTAVLDNEVDTDPEYIQKLRTLTAVRSRLDTVIKTFGDAMTWTFPPSEISASSAFLSVSAPEPGSEGSTIEEKGHQVSKKLRDEIADLLVGSTDPLDSIETAAKRVQELKELSQVWKGTAEEKARIKFVEGLAKMVEDRHRDLLAEHDRSSRMSLEIRTSDGSGVGSGRASEDGKGLGGYGFISQLQKMRGGI